jgi:hypothetical protein
MTDHADGIEHVALEMIERFGDGAAHIARKLAEVSDEVQDNTLTSAETWREIANAIERLSQKP